MAKNLTPNKEIVLLETDVQDKIYLIRERSIMLDSDLATLYNVSTKVLNQAVRRNIERFPEDFMFQLTKEEWINLRSQIVTASWGGRRNEPFAFTEHGVLMLSGVLNSQRAIQVNIRIMRVFNQIRTAIMGATDIRLEIAEIKQTIEAISKKQKGQDQNIELLFEYIDRLQEKQNSSQAIPKTKREIGFKIGESNIKSMEQ